MLSHIENVNAKGRVFPYELRSVHTEMNKTNFEIGLTGSKPDLEGIVELQRLNHMGVVPEERQEAEGFVTMEYSVEALEKMRGNYQHAVAKVKNKIVGYALVMLKECGAEFPALAPMFRELDEAVNKKYFVVAQVCIDRGFRGQGIFEGLMQILKVQMKSDFELVVTEVSRRNQRSFKAYARIGFREISEQGNVEWQVVGLEW